MDDGVLAFRAVSGLSLVVFPAAGVRVALPPGSELADLGTQERDALRAAAVPLTVTERVLESEGEPWLVQQTGPAWADAGAGAADLCGLLFTRLDGSGRRYAVEGGAPGPLPGDDALRSALDGALHGDA